MMAGGVCEFEYVENSIQTKTGQTRLIAWHNAFMQNPHGTVSGMLSAGEDITERKQAEEDLKLAASVFVHANEGIIITDANAAIIDVNQAFTRITGYSREEVLGKKPNLLRSDQNGDTFHREMWQSLQQYGQWSGEIWNRRKNGEAYAELLTISALYDDDDQVHRYLGLFSDITAQKQHQQQLEHSAHYDALTSLPNRILLADRLHQAMVQSHRHDTLLAVAYLDLDGFKLVNDSFGHDVGDQLLVDLSGRFVAALREGDTIARIGGDEFAIAMLDIADKCNCHLVLKRLLNVASAPLVVNGHRVHVSASVGVTFYPQKEEVDADQLLRQADQAMYQAKQSGKNRYHVFDLEKDRSVRDQVDSLSRIESALKNNEFVLHYQPKVNMRTGQVVGVEALIRWNHPERGLLLPVNFLPLIENHELIIELGDWVLKDVLAQLERWQAQGIGLSVSINVNGYHLQQPDFFQNLCASLSACPAVDPSCLELEILETSALEDIAHVGHVIQDCREMGIHFVLDDFGTGYSSLTYLKRLQTRMLKIDQSFVRDMLDDPDDLAILDGVLGLARSFRKQVIAEGVETLEHGEMLLMMGCELGQGYAIAHPMPADDMGDWLERWQPDPRWQQSSKARPEDEMIVHAIVEHRAWVTRLEKYIRGDRAEPPVLDPADCRFGCWLAGFEKEPGSDHAGVEHINLLHKEIHQLAEQVVQHKQDRSGDEADSLLLTIRSLQRDLVVDLKQLILKSRVQFH
ncbi:MAG: diguanylate cyclase [Oceanospirillaceae bacterium]|nr:diguanylate cyclase [Oceanospirillaceae bacterium]